MLAVDAGRREHIRMDHSAAEDLEPAGLLADAATRAMAEHALDVDLGGGLGEREIRRAAAACPSGCSKKCSTKVCSIAFRLAKLTLSPTTMPSTWWNIGVCVMSESLR